MSRPVKNVLLFAGMGALLILVGTMQSWNVALAILNMCLISAVMALGVNIQWGYAGLFNAGVMGFTALGGLAAIVISVAPVPAAWDAGGVRAILGLLAGLATIAGGIWLWKKLPVSRTVRIWLTVLLAVSGYGLMRLILDPAVDAIEAVEPALTGFLGGFGLP
ncbi:MAG: branched-chain amino acid ABC transporter permease, partial [Pseudomonadota bacterium]